MLEKRDQRRWLQNISQASEGLAVRFQEVVHSSKTREADCDEQSTQNWKARMDIHKNARLTLIRREQLAQRKIQKSPRFPWIGRERWAQSFFLKKMTLKPPATAFTVCARPAPKWTR